MADKFSHVKSVKCSMISFHKYLKYAIRYLKFYKIRRRTEIAIQEARVRVSFNYQTNNVKKLFNLDLHIGVIADLEKELVRTGTELTRWSISAHNHLIPGRLPVSDPVKIVNQKTWVNLNSKMIDQFQDRYGKFLKGYDGFVCTYSPTFAELYSNLDKPILVVAATRYEAPYSDRLDDWKRFDNYLINGVNSERIMLCANNKGDADYLNYFTGLNTRIVPSLCERYERRIGSSEPCVIISRDIRLTEEVENQTQRVFSRLSILGEPFDFNRLVNSKEVLIFPQNISTMTLFELATAGVPVAIPSRNWLKKLISDGYHILDELTFHQIQKIPLAHSDLSSPADYQSNKYLDWWLDRADFYDPLLMPNIRVVDSFADLVDDRQVTRHLDLLAVSTATRNMHLASERQSLISDFLKIL
jgi:hypothetical protein